MFRRPISFWSGFLLLIGYEFWFILDQNLTWISTRGSQEHDPGILFEQLNHLFQQVDTFEYRLLRETEFRQSITNRYAEKSDFQTLNMKNDRNLNVLLTPPQIRQKPRNSKLMEGSEAVFVGTIYANPTAQVSK